MLLSSPWTTLLLEGDTLTPLPHLGCTVCKYSHIIHSSLCRVVISLLCGTQSFLSHSFSSSILVSGYISLKAVPVPALYNHDIVTQDILNLSTTSRNFLASSPSLLLLTKRTPLPSCWVSLISSFLDASSFFLRWWYCYLSSLVLPLPVLWSS